MSKLLLLQKPLACRNAHCGAMCSPAYANFFGNNPSKCFNYERRDDLYRKNDVLDKIRAEIVKLQKMCDKNDLNLMAQYSAFGMVLHIIDKYKAKGEEYVNFADDLIPIMDEAESEVDNGNDS